MASKGGKSTKTKELAVDPQKLWDTANKLRGSVDAAEYKHVVLGLIFLKYISDSLQNRLFMDDMDPMDAMDVMDPPEVDRLRWTPWIRLGWRG